MQSKKIGNLDRISIIKKEEIILILYAIILICGILIYSMVSFKESIRYVWRFGTILLFIYSIIVRKYSSRQWGIFLLLSSICVISYIFYKVNIDFLYVALIMFSMSSLSPKKVLSVSAKTFFLTTLFLTIASWCHLIPNLIFYRDGATRFSMGTIYPLTYASLIFFGCAAWMFVYKSNLKNILILSLLSVYIFLITGARNDSINIILLIIACLSVYFNPKINKYLSLVSTFIVYIICFISVFITNFLPYYSNTYIFFNQLFSGRLGLQYTLNNFYCPTLFGQIIPQIGFGGNSTPIANYFYIDNSYVRLLFMNGILLTVLIIYLISCLIFNLYKLELYKQVYIILIIMISGITEDSLVNGAINIFFYILLTTFVNLKSSFKTKKSIDL